MRNDIPLEQQLGCFGYYGFGGGYALSKWGVTSDNRGQLYCGRCERRDACWVRHRARVRILFPDITALADEVAKTHKGDAYLQEFATRSGQSLQHCGEPYLAVMGGNITDGANAATIGAPTTRGDTGLTWPLTPLEPIATEHGK